MSPDSGDATQLADLNDGKNCMSCENASAAPPAKGLHLLSGECRSCIMKATTAGMYPGWKPAKEV